MDSHADGSFFLVGSGCECKLGFGCSVLSGTELEEAQLVMHAHTHRHTQTHRNTHMHTNTLCKKAGGRDSEMHAEMDSYVIWVLCFVIAVWAMPFCVPLGLCALSAFLWCIGAQWWTIKGDIYSHSNCLLLQYIYIILHLNVYYTLYDVFYCLIVSLFILQLCNPCITVPVNIAPIY